MASPTKVESAVALLIQAFHQYSGKEGSNETLTKAELKELLQAEMGLLFGAAPDPSTIDQIFKDLDANKDATVDFREYVTMVACIAMACNQALQKQQ